MYMTQSLSSLKKGVNFLQERGSAMTVLAPPAIEVGEPSARRRLNFPPVIVPTGSSPPVTVSQHYAVVMHPYAIR